jgi:hypothetical protein
MSIGENPEFLHQFDLSKYLGIFESDYGVKGPTAQPESYLDGDLAMPFYAEQPVDENDSIHGFNHAPLAVHPISAIVDLPELFPMKIPSLDPRTRADLLRQPREDCGAMRIQEMVYERPRSTGNCE